MIKKLQALKAKKGFTLVELIVVIAIIGVLAAILVPTMMGMVTKSRVTSVDQTAATIRDAVSTWMMNLDTEGGKVAAVATIKVDVNVPAPTAATSSSKSGKVVVSYEKIDGKDPVFTRANGSAANVMLQEQINADYNFGTKQAHAVVFVKDRKVVGTVYYEGTAVAADATAGNALPGLTNFEAGSYAWAGSQDGILEDGTTVGTSPKLLKDGAASSKTT